MIKYNQNLLVGITPQKELKWIQWNTFNALAVVGAGGSGKTTAAVYWLSQWAIQGVRFFICDPHMDTDEGLCAQVDHLQGAFLDKCVRDYDDITKRIARVHTIGEQRIRGEIPKDQHYPMMLVIDEFTSFIINSPTAKKAAVTLLDATNQYRKVNIRLLVIGQTWGAAVQTTAGLREAISDCVVFKSQENNASKFCLPTTARKAKTLKVGQAFFQDELTYIPRVNDTDKLFTAERIDRYGYIRTHEIKKPAYVLQDYNELPMAML